jgi:hypothetical protein
LFQAPELRGPFAKFADRPYYSESELCGGAVTVSFSKHLPWQVMHFLQHSTHFSKTCCRPLITSKFLALELPFHGWKSPGIAWDEIWTVWLMFWCGSTDPLFTNRTQNSIQISPHVISGLFQPCKGAPKQEISKRTTVCSTFSRSGWSVVRSASLDKEGTSKKRPSPHLYKVQTRTNNVSPRTLQTTLVLSKHNYNYALQ